MMEYHDHGHENNPKLSRGEDTKTIPGFNYRMTELQAVVGKVQLKKVNYILQQNFKRYQILKKYLSKYFDLRKVPINSIPNYDTFIFYVNKNEKRKVLKLINDSKFGTKIYQMQSSGIVVIIGITFLIKKILKAQLKQ